MLERGRPRPVVGRERDEALAEVSGRGHAEVAAEPARRPAVVGHGHDRRDLGRVLARGAQRDGESVPTAERDDLGSRSRPVSAVTFDVLVVHRGVVAVAAQAFGELLRDHDTAMAATGAAERDRQIRLALALVAGQQQREEAVELVEELAGAALAEHVVAHGIVEAR